jgi:hypothetical protein
MLMISAFSLLIIKYENWFTGKINREYSTI